MAFSPSAQLHLANCSSSDTKHDDMKQMWDELPQGHYEEATKSEPYVRYVDVNNNEPVNYCDRQIYLPFDIDSNKTGKLIALLDTGADVNFITDGYLRTKVPDWRKYKMYNGPTHIRSMTGEPVKPLGHRMLPIRFDRCTPVEMPFVILAEEVPVKCIIGREMLAQFRASLFYADSVKTWPVVGCSAHRYVLKVLDPRPANLPLLHLRMPGPFEVRAEYVRLPPKEPTTVRFLMTINPFFTEEDHCLVCFTSVMPDGIVAMDTRCRPEFKKDGKVEVLGMIVNDTDNEVTLRIAKATVDSTRDYDAMVSIVSKPYFRNEQPKNRLPEARPEKMEKRQRKADRSIYLVSHVNHGPDKGYKRLLKKNKFREINGMQGLCFPNYHCNSKPQDSSFYCCQIRLSNGDFSNEEPFETAEELLDEEIMPSLALPPRLPTAEEVVLKTLHEEDEEIQPYLRKLFIEKYPAVVGTHNLDTGPVRYLGRITLRTKPGMRLPRSSKVYPMNNSDQQHMGDILDFMEKYGFIGETFQDDPSRPSKPWGASAFLVKRKAKPGLPNAGSPGFGRLIIDYKAGGLNNVLQETPALVKSIEACLEELRGNHLFSLIDLKQSYYGLCLSAESFALTQFIVFPGRSFVWHRLPMGISTAPASLLEKCNLMLNYIPKKDANGTVLYEKGEDPTDEAARAQLVPDKVKNCINFYDDLLIFSKKSLQKETVKGELTLEEHFFYVERLIQRMDIFGFKVTYHKCVWGKRYVDFLGWRVKDDILMADEGRIEKVKKFEYPKTRKQLQGFVGLVNTLKRVAPLRVGEFLATLSEISSSKLKFEFEDKHKEAFDNIKKALTEEPLYCHLIDPEADKIIFSDSSNLAFGSVLLSRVSGQRKDTFSSHIHQNDPDPLNQVIRKWKINSYIGEKYADQEDSFFKSILFLIKYHKLHHEFHSTLELRHALIKHVKTTFIGQQIKEQFCHGDSQEFHHLLHTRVGNLRGPISAQDIIILMVASFLGKGINVIVADPGAGESPLHEVIPDLKTAAVPISIGAYPQGRYTTACKFVPLLDFKAWEFNPALLNSKYVVNYYDSKIVPKEHRDKSILELESTALLCALKKYRAYLTNCQTHVITDSRSLYYLFSNAIVQSHAKVSRYNLKLQADYANVQVLWCNTYDNLADLFSRFGLDTEYETKIKFATEKIHRIRDIPDGMTFSWESWENIVRSHPKAIEVLLDFQKTYKTKDKAKLAKLQEVYHPPENQSDRSGQRQVKDSDIQTTGSPNVAVPIKPQNPRREIESFQDTIRRRVHYTRASVAQLRYLIKPIKLLRSRLSKANIQLEQSTMMPDLYSKLLQSGNYRCTEEKVNYELIDNVIYCRQDDKSSPRIVIPLNMELLCMAYIHLTYGHASPLQMQKTIEYAYHFQSSQLYKKVKLFCASCTACSLTARNTLKGALRHLSIKPDTPPFTIITIDLAENLTIFLQYFSHMLIVKCLTTGFTLLFPLKSKAGPEIYYSLLFGVFQPFGLPKCIYSDNAQIFRAHRFRDLLGTLDIELKDTTPLDSKSRGYIERAVRTVKQGIRKHVHSINPPRERVDVYPLISILNHNLNHNARFGNSPSRLLFGRQINTNGLFDARAFIEDETAPLIMNGDQKLGALPQVIAAQNQKVAEHVDKAQKRADASVKRPVDKKLPPGTLIYVLAQGLGSTGTSKAWAAYYFPSVYSVTREMDTSIIAIRLSDGQTICRSKNSVKRVMYWPRFQELPADIRRLLVLNYDQLQQEGLEKLAFSDTFGPLPPSNFENEGVLSHLDGLDMQNDFSSSSSSENSDDEAGTPNNQPESDSGSQSDEGHNLRNRFVHVRFKRPR